MDDGREDAATGTATHPFWAVNLKDWVPLSELTPGDTLLLADAGTARVIEVVGPTWRDVGVYTSTHTESATLPPWAGFL